MNKLYTRGSSNTLNCLIIRVSDEQPEETLWLESGFLFIKQELYIYIYTYIYSSCLINKKPLRNYIYIYIYNYIYIYIYITIYIYIYNYIYIYIYKCGRGVYLGIKCSMLW